MVNRALRHLHDQVTEAAKLAANEAEKLNSENLSGARFGEVSHEIVDLTPRYSGGKTTEILIVVGLALAIAACCISYFAFKKGNCHNSYVDGK